MKCCDQGTALAREKLAEFSCLAVSLRVRGAAIVLVAPDWSMKFNEIQSNQNTFKHFSKFSVKKHKGFRDKSKNS